MRHCWGLANANVNVNVNENASANANANENVNEISVHRVHCCETGLGSDLCRLSADGDSRDHQPFSSLRC